MDTRRKYRVKVTCDSADIPNWLSIMHEASKSYIERSDDRMCLRLVDIRGLLGFEAVMDFQVLIVQKSRVSTLDGRNAINFCPPISKLSEESRVVRTINPCLSNSTRVIEAIDAGAL